MEILLVYIILSHLGQILVSVFASPLLPSILESVFTNHTIHIINFEACQESFDTASNIFLSNNYIPVVLDFFPHNNLELTKYNMDELEDMSKPVVTALTEFKARFSGTIVTIIMSALSENSTEIENQILDTLRAIVTSTENPDYIFLQLDSDHIDALRYLYLNAITLPGIFLVFGEDVTTSVICIPCMNIYTAIVEEEEDEENHDEFSLAGLDEDEGDGDGDEVKAKKISFPLHSVFNPEVVLVPVEDFKSMEEIEDLWDKLSSNMLGSLVHPFHEFDSAKNLTEDELDNPELFINEVFKPSICSMYYSQLHTEGRKCTMLMLGRKYNYSSLSDDSSKSTNTEYGFVDHGKVANKMFNNAIIIRRSPDECSWFQYAVTFHPFNYLVIAGKSSINFKMLLMPFDKWIWICTIISFFSMVTLFVWLSSSLDLNPEEDFDDDDDPSISSCSSILKFKDKLFWTISVVCDQSDDGITRRNFSNLWKSSPWIVIWLFVSFTLGVIYKGSLFSCLTASIPPQVPTGLKKIVQDKFPLYTLSAVGTAWRGVYQVESMLKSAIMPDLLASKTSFDDYYCSKYGCPETHVGTNGSISQEYLQNLYDHIAFLEGNKFEIAQDISKQIGVKADNRTVKVSKDFALLDTESELKDFTQAYLFFMDAITVKGTEMTPFITRVPWFGWRNFFYPVFNRGLGQLVASGIYQRWNKYSDFQNQREKLEDLNNIIYDEMYYAKMMAGSKNPVVLGEAKPVEYRVMRIPFIFTGWLLAVSVIVLGVEIIVNTHQVLRERARNFRFYRGSKVEIFVYIP